MRFLKASFFSVFFLTFVVSNAQIWDWARAVTDKNARINDLCVDQFGDITVIGDRGEGTMIGNTQIDRSGIFLAKYTKEGVLLWAKPYTSNNLVSIGFRDEGLTIQVDEQGNFYIGGKQNGFPFLSKLDTNGEEIWSIVGDSPSYFPKLEKIVLHNGLIYACGNFGLTHGNQFMRFGTLNLAGRTGAHPFIVVVDPDGNTLQGLTIPEGRVRAIDIAIDDLTNIYLFGNAEDRVDFGNGVSINTSSTGQRTFLARYNDELSIIWAITSQGGNQFDDQAHSITLDRGGNPIIFGNFEGAFILGDTLKESFTEGTRLFLAGVSAEGTPLWLRNFDGGGGFAAGQGAEVYFVNDTTFYLGSSFTRELGLPNGELVEYNCFGTTMWISRFNQFGDPHWHTFVGCPDPNDGDDVTLYNIRPDQEGSIFAVGQFDIRGIFGIDTLTTFELRPTFLGRLLNEASKVGGTTFRDFNGNGIKDSTDVYIPSINVMTEPGNLVTASDTNGKYQFNLNLQSFDIFPSIPPHHIISLPAEPGFYTIQAENIGQITDTLDFGFQPIPGIQDIEVELFPLTPARPGFEVEYLLKIRNTAITSLDSVRAELYFPANLSLISSTASYDSIGLDSIAFPLLNFPAFTDTCINLTFVLNRLTSLDAELFLQSTLFPIVDDLEPLDNIDTLIHPVSGSFDPNDKQVFPVGDIFPEFLQNGSFLTYRIRFQNTGTDTAFTVRVRDTLSPFLDYSSFQTIAASHKFEIELKADGAIEWIFRDILLPDSTTNEPASNGFILFKIRPIQDLAIGSEILNNASIYFDFNEPIQTNTVSTKLDIKTRTESIDNTQKPYQLHLYPNPTTHYLYIQSDLPGKGNYQIYNAVGSLIKTGQYRDNETLILPLTALPKSSYFIQLKTSKGIVSKQFVKQ